MKRLIVTGSKVKIKYCSEYSYDKRFPCLAIGSQGRVKGVWHHPATWKTEQHYLVELECGTFPFYKEELELC